jgi:microcystin-dependent protein
MAAGSTQVVRVLNVSQMARGLPIMFNALPGIVGTPGPQGPPGNPAYTQLVNPFAMPVPGTSVNLTVVDTSWMIGGGSIYVGGAGYFTVQSVFDATHATVVNINAPGNVAPGTVVSAPQGISTAGPQGATGVQGPIGPVGPQGAVGPQGTGVNYRAAWNGASNYAINDAVSYGGSSYVALKTSVGVVPGTDPTTWGIFAQKGDTGATGATGLQGPTGQTGATGAAGPASTSITQAQYTQPAVNANVTIAVDQTSWCPPGSVVFIAGGGYYEVESVPDSTHMVLLNPGWENAAPPGSTVPSGSLVTAGGVEGAPGNPGSTGAVGPQGPQGTPGAQAYSILQSAFAVPAPGSVVTMTVDSTAWMVTTLVIYIVGAGYYQVNTIGGANLLTATNLGYSGNATPATTIASGALIYAGGAPQTVNRDYYYNDFDAGWADWAITSGTVTKGGQVDADSQGIAILGCAAASGSTYGLQIGTGASANQIGNRTSYFHAKVQIPTLSTGADSFGFYFGWLDNVPTAAFQNGVFFYYTNGGSTPNNWGCYCRRAGTQVFSDSGVVVATGQWYDLEVTVDSVYATFSIAHYANGAVPSAPVMVAQISISQCPAAGVGLGAVFGGSKLAGSSVAPSIYVDAYEHEILYKGTVAKFRQPAIVGPPGKNSLTGTTASFVTPAIGGNSQISVADTTFMTPGMQLYIAGAGTYQVVSVTSPTQVVVQNTGATGNVPPTTQINAGASVTVSGVAGPQGVIGPVGPIGPVGQGASTTLTNSFVQPNIGNNVNVPVVNSSFIAPGSILYIQSGGYYIVQSVPNLQNLTVQNPGYTGNAVPGATVLNNSLVTPGGVVGPAGADPAIVGSIMAWASSGIPQGWLFCDGTAVSRATYLQLYNVLGGAASPWGQGDGSTTFNVPDLRGRMILGVGSTVPAMDAGLTNRPMATKGGVETYALASGEMPIHTHTATSSEADHRHSIPAGPNHTHSDSGHGHSDAGHAHNYSVPVSGNASYSNALPIAYSAGTGTTTTGYANIQTGYAQLSTAGNLCPGFTNYASATGIPGVTTTIANAGGGAAHQNMPPFVATNYIIKAAYNAPVGPTVPRADTTQDGLLAKVSGLMTDYVGGDNACHDLASAVRTYAPVIRSYNSVGNSNFEIDARTVGAGVSAAGFALDRWQYQQAGTNRGTADQNNAAGGVLIAGSAFAISANFLRYTITTQQGTLGAGDYIIILQMVEGSRLRELLGGQTSISIVCRSSVANTVFGCFLRDSALAYSLTKLCTLTNANAWTLISLPSIANWSASGTYPITPGVVGYQIGICLACGSTFTSAANDVWSAGNFLGAKTQGSFAGNAVGSTFDLAYIGHEPGATPNGVIDIEFATNQRSCDRYWQKSYDSAVAIATVTNAGMVRAVNVGTQTQLASGVTFRERMAKDPTVTLYSAATGAVNNVRANGAAADKAATAAAGNVSETGYVVNLTAAPTAAESYQWHHAADTGW